MKSLLPPRPLFLILIFVLVRVSFGQEPEIVREVEGAFENQGVIVLSGNKNLGQLLSRAVITKRANLKRLLIVRKKSDGLKLLIYNLKAIDDFTKFEMKDGDRVFLPTVGY